MFYFIANWKMNAPALPAWVKLVAEARYGTDHEIVLCPAFTQLAAANMVLAGTEIALGAQDCHAMPEGAYTGDVSADMLKRSGCSYVIVGHSERREQHQETSAQVKAKAQAAVASGLQPIICVGESLAQREAGQALAVVSQQLAESLPEGSDDYLIAYEPIWAIGSGLTATPSDIASMHSHIKKSLDKPLPVLYGGSVKPNNAAEILALDGVDGVLVGSASLKGDDFAAIIGAC